MKWDQTRMMVKRIRRFALVLLAPRAVLAQLLQERHSEDTMQLHPNPHQLLSEQCLETEQTSAGLMNTTSALLSEPNLAYINAGICPAKGGGGITRTSNCLKRHCNRTTTTFLLAKIHPTPGSYQLYKERLIKNHKELGGTRHLAFLRKQQIPQEGSLDT